MSHKGKVGVKKAEEAAMSAKKLRQIREDLKMTQPQFAEALGVTAVTISLWENGHTPISKTRKLAIEGLVGKLKGKAA